MTNEEALDYFKSEINRICSRCYEKDGCENCPAIYPHKIALEAIEKQIPRNPKGHGIGYIDNTCICCGEKVSISQDYGNVIYTEFCPSCGQRILWEEEVSE